MKIHIGQAALRGSIRRYPFDLLELLVEPHLPQPKKLATWREEKPECVFSLRLQLESGASADQQRLAQLEAARDALAARWLVVTTTPTTTPTTRHRDLLARLLDSCRSDTWRIAWEPRGVWTPEEAERWAEELGVTLVRDLRREEVPPGSVQYTRLRALGSGTRTSVEALERVAMRLEGAEEAYVVLEGEGASRTAQLLRELCGQADGSAS